MTERALQRGDSYTGTKRRNNALRGTAFTYMDVLATVACAFIVATMFVYHSRAVSAHVKKLKCQSNLCRLYQALVLYSSNYHGTRYPAPDKWCDLLIEANAHSGNLSIFACPSVKTSDDNKKCHYAINPNCRPQSPPDTVLLFETKGGWNQSGGPELMAFENHNRKGCHVLFNNGNAAFITPDHVEELKWETDPNSRPPPNPLVGPPLPH